MSASASLHARLPQMAPAEAAARNRLLSALNGPMAEGEGSGALTLRASIVPPSEEAPGLVFETDVGMLRLTPERVAGQPARLAAVAAPDLPEILAEMSRLEPLIAALERLCGRPLDPCGLSAEPGPGLGVRLEALDAEGRPVHAVRLLVPEPLAIGFTAPPLRALGPAARASAVGRLILQGPAAPRTELAWLEAGDVVLLPDGLSSSRPAWLAVGRIVLRGGLDLAAAEFHAYREDPDMLDVLPGDDALGEPAPAPETVGRPIADLPLAEPDLADLPVRLQVVLPQMEIPVSVLAGLAPGAVAPLPIEGEALKVDILAAGVRIASGQLVALGSAYGVLIEQVAGGKRIA